MQNLSKVKYLAKGKRSFVYSAIYKKQEVVIKKIRISTKSKGRIKNEANFLRILNKYDIGPKLIAEKRDYLILEKINGILLIDFLKTSNKKEKIDVIKNIIKQCFTLDKLKINKEEFHKPIKHIIIQDNNPRLIDFEKCYITKKPKNVTQFFQFLYINKNIKKIPKPLLIKYKKKINKTNLDNLLKYLELNFF